MSYLKWKLSEGEIDVVDPMGDLHIIGDDGEIVEKFTNLDVFLGVLVEASNSIKIGKSVVIDPFTEPHEFHFDFQDRILTINYGRQQTTILNRGLFLENIEQAVTELLAILDEQSAKENKPKRELVKLRDYTA